MNDLKRTEYEELLRSSIKISKETGTEMAVQVTIGEDGRIYMSIGPRTEAEATNTENIALQTATTEDQTGKIEITKARKTREMEERDIERDIERSICEVLKRMGIPAHILGYKYAVRAIRMALDDHDILNNITKGLYPDIAKMYKTTPSRVERAIRHAIEVSWKRGDMEYIEELFGYTVNYEKGKPTNSEFIAIVMDHLRFELKM